ncbi:MAG: pentapeptide repeat-containing protein [Candidatus Methanofastidiosia archaeon]
MEKRCQYMMKMLDRKSNKYIEGQCLEKVWYNSENYCIFHDPSPEKDIQLFYQKIKEKINKKNYDFQGYYFPEEIDLSSEKFETEVFFNGAVFSKNVIFSRTIFSSTVDFSRCKFKKKSNFNRSTFKEGAYFNGAIFNGFASFGEAKFLKKAHFSACTFLNGVRFRRTIFQGLAEFIQSTIYEDGIFINARFKKDTYFNGAIFEDAYFIGTSFRNADFEGAIIKKVFDFRPGTRIKELNLKNMQIRLKSRITADLRKTRFLGADLEDIDFFSCRWPENGIIYEEKHMKELHLDFRKLEGIYRSLKQNMQRHGNDLRAGKFFYREMEMRRKGARKTKFRLWYEIYRAIAGYGELPQNTVSVSGGIVFVFAFLFWALQCLTYPAEHATISEQIIDCVYFSFVTFTTLGLGDIYPSTILGKVLICCEAVVGAFLIALFVAIFVRKITR